MKQTRGQKAFQILNVGLMVILCAVTLYPFLYILALSFNDGLDALKGGLLLFPRQLTLVNYKAAFQEPNILNAFGISILRTLLGTVLSLLFISMQAYALSDKQLPGRRWMIKYFFFTTLFGGGLIPFFILLRDLNLVNNFCVYVLPAIYGFYSLVIMRASFEGMPESIVESAKMDGAGDVRVFWQFVLPLNKPILATVALFTGVFHWNDWYAGTFYIRSASLKPAATLLRDILAEATFESGSMSSMYNTMQSGFAAQAQVHTTPQALQMAFVIIITVPVLLIYPFLQKYFVKGALVGSIKE
jgi:putative aldouronate transport system permease protein